MKDLTGLKGAPYNPRKITDKKLSDLEISMLAYGDLSGIVKNIQTGNTFAGNQRTKVALKLDSAIINIVHENSDGPDQVGTIREGYIILQENGARFNYREVMWDEATEWAASLAANNLHGENVDSGVAQLLDQINAVDPGKLSTTGFEADDIDKLLKSVNGETAKKPTKPKTEFVEPQSYPGQTYELGPHRITCGNGEQRFVDVVRQQYAEAHGAVDDWVSFTPAI